MPIKEVEALKLALDSYSRTSDADKWCHLLHTRAKELVDAIDIEHKLAWANSEVLFLRVIHEWEAFWMNQKQNSEEDFKNYFRRAFNVDANMQHDLARRLKKAFFPTDSEDEVGG